MRNKKIENLKKNKIKIHSKHLFNTYYPSNPEKILYPKLHITKLDLANYYINVQEWILPYLVNRFLTIVRCPDGVQNVKKECFYQRHLNKDKTDIYSINGQTKINTAENYFYIKDISGLLSLVQLGVLEIHPWGCRIDKVEKPDLIIFDLDPGQDVEWKNIIEAAFFIKEKLTKLHLISFVKTTGGKGLHIVLPIKRRYSCSNFCKIFGNP
ncbi:MAG: hypothetical protein REH83_03035 [Rickettsiella sp.]|nr:hypothetical protein [Rickettsiella sp.]